MAGCVLLGFVMTARFGSLSIATKQKNASGNSCRQFHRMTHNVELTGAARLYRAASSDSRDLHANLEKALGEIEKKIEHIDYEKTAVKGVLASMTPYQLARCLAASAIHQIGGTLESESMLSENTLLADLTNEMRKCAGDILETANSDPWVFYVMINTAVSSGVLKLIDMKGESDE